MEIKHIPTIMGNVNRYLKRKTLPKKDEDCWIVRCSKKKRDRMWKMLNSYQQNISRNVYSDIESGQYELRDFATYVLLYNMNEDDFYFGGYDDNYYEKIKKIKERFSRDVYLSQVKKIEMFSKKENLHISDIVRIDKDGYSLLFDLVMKKEIGLALASTMHEWMGHSKYESKKHKLFQHRMKILRAIRKKY